MMRGLMVVVHPLPLAFDGGACRSLSPLMRVERACLVPQPDNLKNP